MRKLILSLACVSFAAIVACESKKEESSAKQLDNYVDSVKTLSDDNQKENWTQIEGEYQARAAKAEANSNTEEEKKQLEEAKSEFQTIRSKYKTETDTDETVVTETDSSSTAVSTTDKQKLRDELFGQGKIGSDLSFSWVTAKNILSVYESFVASVKANKDSYSREDWDEVKVLYEALDTRKNEVEKDLSSKDNMQIAKRKVEFASYNSVDRPASKVTENEEAKEKN